MFSTFLVNFSLFNSISFSKQRRAIKFYYDWMEKWSLHLNSKCFKDLLYELLWILRHKTWVERPILENIYKLTLDVWMLLLFRTNTNCNTEKASRYEKLFLTNMNLSWCPIYSAICILYILRAIGFVVSHETFCVGNFFYWSGIETFRLGRHKPNFMHWKSDSWIYTQHIQKGKLCAHSQQLWVLVFGPNQRQAIQGKTISKTLDLYHQYVWICLTLSLPPSPPTIFFIIFN